MFYVLSFILGGVVFVPLALLISHHKHGEKRRADETRYKNLYNSSLDLMASGGQLTDNQVASLRTSSVAGTTTLKKGIGFSSDRRDTEIARAKKGLEPEDNLAGMFSSDVRKVKAARIKYGTAR